MITARNSGYHMISERFVQLAQLGSESCVVSNCHAQDQFPSGDLDVTVLLFTLRLSLDNDRSRVKSEQFPLPLDPPTKILSVVVPAYNEEERLPGMLETTLEYLEDRHQQDR